MLDIATAYNKYQYLGNDFLTWIWFMIETDQPLPEIPSAGLPVRLEIGNSLVLENSLGDKSKERITIKGDQAGLEEGATALKKGAKVTELNLIMKLGEEEEYKFTLKGESFNITGLKTPSMGKADSEDEIEGMVLEKAYFIFKVSGIIDTLFFKFVDACTQEEWKNKGLQQMREWVYRY
ncbi:MAG: hypothetical protein MI747_14675 [Desulfobacterales bacterium]|nr:hypothetical protein [Desulfobacterales bacterium]